MVRQFYLTAAAGLVVTTSLASNLLWVMAFGSKAARVHGRLQLVLRDLRDFVDESVAAAIARRERQAAYFKLDDLSNRDLRDIGLYRDRFGLVLAERDGPLAHVSRHHQAGGRRW